jgi:hypothetical protein
MIAAPNPAEDFIQVVTDNLYNNEVFLVNALGRPGTFSNATNFR